MSFRLRSKKDLKFVIYGTLLTLVISCLFIVGTDDGWTVFDHRLLDYFYRQAVRSGYGPKPSFQPRIVYLTITDNSYNYFKKNILDRSDLARINEVLQSLKTEAVVYDIIFARPSNKIADQQFAASLESAGRVYLPYGCAVSEKPARFRWENGTAMERLKSDFLGHPTEKGDGMPRYANRLLMQYDEFAARAWGSGDISAEADQDSVYRHKTLLIKVDDAYVPTLSLSIFLDWAGVRLNDVTIEWGSHIRIPTDANGQHEIVIPIDNHGRAVIPFVDKMGRDFPVIEAHTLLETFEQPDLRGNLEDFFDGAFVLIGDTAAGISDLGDTPLERSVPLITLHAAMLNGLLTSTFYGKWQSWQIAGLFAVISLLLGLASAQRHPAFLYLACGLILAGLQVLCWLEIIHFRLLPIATAIVFAFLAATISIVMLQVTAFKDRSFIRDTFSRYVPEKVVHELLDNPEAIKLGGEEREATVLFSDIAGFTTLSEQMSPSGLVSLLNEYLTEMADIIMQEGGIVDKFEGDAIMAEFGIPFTTDDHADQAVRAALAMQKRLEQLRAIWKQKRLPELYCRIGINTGRMLVGNMGSNKVMDYTVIGDEVNLAARLEEANKEYKTSIMISEATLERLSPGLFQTRYLDEIKVKGKNIPVKIYEVCKAVDADIVAI